ncbi:MAG: hypothetical protein H8E98_01165 [Bacteroidetes bacterium]|nr:hypothetical protein [Bacteroidota bacterium]
MTMIQYTDMGTLFIGVGMLAIYVAVAVLIFITARWFSTQVRLFERHITLEIVALDRVAQKKGIDLNKEIAKMKIEKSARFRHKVEKEMYEEVFGKEKEEK